MKNQTTKSKCCGAEETAWLNKETGERFDGCSKCGKPFFPLRKGIEEMYEFITPLVDKMKAKYPSNINIEGLEPALTNDIAEIILDVLSSQESKIREEIAGKIEKFIKVATGNNGKIGITPELLAEHLLLIIREKK